MKKNLDVCVLLDFYGNLLTDKQREAIDYYYNEDLSLAEISEHTNTTRQGVRDNIKRAEAILFETEEKLGFAAQFDKARSDMEEIEKVLIRLEELNARRLYSQEVTEMALQIRSLTRDLFDTRL